MKALLKILIFILLIMTLFTSEIFAQKITQGTYRLVFGFDKFTNTPLFESEYSIKIIIQNDSLFSYDLREDLGYSLGKGFYSIKNNELVLKFDKMILPFDTLSYNILSSIKSTEDSIEYTFLIRDNKDHVPLSSALIKIFHRNELLNDSEKINDFYADENGNCTVKISNSKLPVSIFVTYIGYDVTYFTLKDPLNSSIAINMNFSSSRVAIDSGKTITYKIKDIEENGFYLKGDFLYKWTYFLKTN